MSSIEDGIIIGATGGAIAGLAVYTSKYLHDKAAIYIEGRRIFRWLKNNTADEKGKQFRSTRAIASWNNLTEDRARYICSKHSNIFIVR